MMRMMMMMTTTTEATTTKATTEATTTTTTTTTTIIIGLIVIVYRCRFLCYVKYIGFNVSFTVVYSPLLTRTNRIFRIFNSARKSTSLPSFITSGSQIVIAMTLIAVQVTSSDLM